MYNWLKRNALGLILAAGSASAMFYLLSNMFSCIPHEMELLLTPFVALSIPAFLLMEMCIGLCGDWFDGIAFFCAVPLYWFCIGWCLTKAYNFIVKRAKRSP